ncbi:MAG: metallophosphoesterase [Lachnospiraceae bacterium]|nr:metallophosphoesterase [Lachnospiraceae bacterium]
MRFKRFAALSLCVSLVFSGFSTLGTPGNTSKVLAAEEVVKDTSLTASGSAVEEEIESDLSLRVIFTTDIHGQVINYDYQTASFVDRGYNKVATLIDDAKGEVPEGESLTFDLGDSIMDFTSDYIYSANQSAIQPVFKAIKQINYDAITLGNHDFDYGYDYIVNQLSQTSLTEKVVLSNVDSVYNGTCAIGADNKIITKTLKTKDGEEVKVKVGIIGETVPSLSTRTESFKDEVKTEDIITNATAQVKLLKNSGADIIIALAHSGFGTENPTARSANCAYALTKVDGIDLVLAGHQHIQFPNTDTSAAEYSLSGVDKKTGLVNGKRLMMIRDSCRNLGVTDLKFDIGDNGKVSLVGSDYEFKDVKTDTIANEGISQTMSAWDSELRNYCEGQIGNIGKANNKRWTNYFGSLESDPIMQAVNDTQIAYAMSLLRTEDSEYKDLPIVSMTRYNKFGSSGGGNYADIEGKIKNGNIDAFTNYHRYAYIYKVTVAQFREWLEWSASMYEKIGDSTVDEFDDIIINEYVNSDSGQSLISNEWLDNLNKFFKAGGVEYSIDPTVAPRYDYYGNKINDTYRVKSLTINGKAMVDTDYIALVCEKFSSAIKTEATTGITDNVISKSHLIMQEEVIKYLKYRAHLGDISINENDEYRVLLPDNYNYILKTGYNSEDIAFNKEFVRSVYGRTGEFIYYNCRNTVDNYDEDKVAPNIVLAQSNYEDTNLPITINISVHDRSGLKNLKYAYGDYDKDDSIWKTATVVSGNSITVKSNGIYTFYAEDSFGNKCVVKHPVINYITGSLTKPTVKKVKNNAVVVKGTAYPGLTAVVKIDSALYTGTVGTDGNYSVTIPVQNAKKKIYVYVTDKYGRTSKKVKVVVKRAGPNCPTVNKVKNTATVIKGNTNDKKQGVYALVDGDVYVDKSSPETYTKCKKYNSKLKMIKTKITVSSKGVFKITIPVQDKGVKVKVFTVDKLGRVSRASKKTVKKVAPNKPVIYEVYDMERYVFGTVNDGTGVTVNVKVGNKTYLGLADENGKFAVKTCGHKAGKVLKIFGSQKLSGKVKCGKTTSVTVKKLLDTAEEYRDGNITLKKLKNKSKVIKGEYSYGKARIFLNVAGKGYTVLSKSDGSFTVNIKKKLKKKQVVYAFVRSGKTLQSARKRVVV